MAMYTQFYGLKEKPFNLTPDPTFFFSSKRHREAISCLLYGINQRVGFLQITGEIGTGKTTLCRALLSKLDPKTKTAIVLNPNLPATQLLEAIVQDFGITVEKKTKLSIISSLNEFLINQLKNNSNVVIIIDEAQNMRNQLLEQIRMLSNIETEKEKLFQIVLVGQPQLRDKLNSPTLQQLRQRISVRYHILPLDKEELREYINHRLAIAGANGSIEIIDSALEEIFNYSKGTPRLINIVCDRSLLLGFVLETRRITADMVRQAIADIEDQR